MIAAVLALTASTLFGSGDFLAGLAARRTSLLAVVAISQLIGLVLAAAAAPLLGHAQLSPGDLAWGAAGGVATIASGFLLFGAMARGSMSVVAPITAICAITLPVLVGWALGERLAALRLAGIGLALVAVVLIGLEGTDDEAPAAARRATPPAALLMALGAGVAIAGFYVCLQRTSPAAGLWPLVATRAVSGAGVTAFWLLALRRGRSSVPARPVILLALASGTLDIAANLLYLIAVHQGQLGIVATLASLYPASTVLLAWLVAGEPIRRIQAAGLATALIAILLITGA
jgi:drug/metabolite transporter (DMT)-like permease